MPIPSDSGRLRQAELFIRGLAGLRPRVPVDADLLERRACGRMDPAARAYVAGGAGAGRTMAANRRAFERWAIVPRVLRDVSARDLGVELFGERLPAPLLLAPIGVLELAHPGADLAVARAAAAEGVPFVFSSQASVPMERCAEAMRALGGGPRWFQLYYSTLDPVVESFVRRAEACGCRAIVLTLDTTMLGWRPRDLDLAYLPFLRGRGLAQYVSDPAFLDALATPPPAQPQAAQPPAVPAPPLRMRTLLAALEQLRRHPGRLRDNLRSGRPRAAVQRFIATYSRPSLGWDDVARLRRLTRLPLVLKGVLHPDDARRALEHGVDGLVVSNHGGRQVDHAVAALDALPAVVGAVGGRVPVLFDSGIRTGADAFVALALGATAVCLGRPYVYGLALAGEAGVREVIRNVVAELDLTMGLAGCTRLADVGRAMLAERP